MTTALTRILVVDDDPTARLLFRSALRAFEFEVCLAIDGEDGLRQCREKPFDLVMLDIDMPGMDGYQVCTTLRREADPLLPILMVTGMDDVESVEQAYQSGATDFIAKPINWPLIGHRLKHLLRGHQTLLDLRAADARNAAILNAIPDLLFEVDLEGRYLSFHSPSSALLTVPPEDFLGKTANDILPPEAARECMAALLEAHKNGASNGRQYELQLKSGPAWFELSVARKKTATDDLPRFIVLCRDITERKESEAKIRQLAFFDVLTGLPNRQSFLARVEREIRRSSQIGIGLAVLFMDLDGFKAINDTLGHGAGDQALQWAADRLREAVRAVDVVSHGVIPTSSVEIARLGGDEFTALILDIKCSQDVVVVAQRILQLMRQPFTLNGKEVMLTASIGIALYQEDGEDGATLLKHADAALYLAKDAGRDNFKFYSAKVSKMNLQRLELKSDLRLALERKEFCLLYQPQIDAVSGRIQAVEALIRWNRPGFGIVSPLDFIPAAEQSGLIVPIGQWVLRTACTVAADWARKGMRLRVAVNLSPVQFKDPDLVQDVLDILAQTGLEPGLLELEITESTVMEDTAENLATLTSLRDCGVHIALDDFGTGYSSLSYLKQIPLNNLKVDRSFVMCLPQDVENRAIVRAILAMASSLGLVVTAEGVETFEQAMTLKRMSCSMLQGYYFSKPVSMAAIPALLEQRWLWVDPLAAHADVRRVVSNTEVNLPAMVKDSVGTLAQAGYFP